MTRANWRSRRPLRLRRAACTGGKMVKLAMVWLLEYLCSLMKCILLRSAIEECRGTRFVCYSTQQWLECVACKCRSLVSQAESTDPSSPLPDNRKWFYSHRRRWSSHEAHEATRSSESSSRETRALLRRREYPHRDAMERNSEASGAQTTLWRSIEIHHYLQAAH